ncbi:Xaa-Pro aminopeptidase [Arcticibacter svalbardensis MN12-7]|uniref:Xaa-Pro aminopeptidase n=1 Tax=Arcticibacter svalbardensis MN12-7 TaxID=1150600 RepID=R9GXW5_9SPHI|nr:aminopeptidase P family protein [Arcticibacter svalbardensis]EOR96513.1 Xaa-Pro aminopeptidase [Arcticibacter svalbardensis MN12-7]
MTYQEKLSGIRRQMRDDRVDAYIIPSADPHISEYLPDRYKCIYFTSGFTGSAGTLVITQEFAGLWTDARYFVQAAEQLENSGFELVKLIAQATPEYITWLTECLKSGAVVGFDSNLISVQLAQMIAEGLDLADIGVAENKDYLTDIWTNRPELPASAAFLLNEEITGESVPSKLQRIREVLKKKRSAYHLISSLDDVAWVFNIRGADVKCNPVTLGFALISPDETRLYIDAAKLSSADQSTLKSWGVEVWPYVDVNEQIQSIPKTSSILIDPKKTCNALYQIIPAGVKIVQDTNPSTNFKAVKNEVEIANIRQTMVRDGVALTRFFRWMETNPDQATLTEISVAEKLYAFRAEQEGFVGESFDTIAGYAAHGALPHYKATPESDVPLLQTGLFLLDSGGQYLRGTTDITRVISLGNLSQEEKTDYTLVLRAMIEGSTARFPKGSKGYQIDAITRKPLWDFARNYGHGTGHGIGYFLNVHEGPQVFNASNSTVEIDLGMITSVEPGLYRPLRYGIRIENLVLTVKDEETEFGEFYTFETLTQFLIDTSLVDQSLLEAKHVKWLNAYNEKVVAKLSPFLDAEDLLWLQKKAQAI